MVNALCFWGQSLESEVDNNWSHAFYKYANQQQEVRVDLLLNQIPEPTLAAELVVNTKGEVKKG